MPNNNLGNEWYWLPVVSGLTALLKGEVKRMRETKWHPPVKDVRLQPDASDDDKYRTETRAPDGRLNNLAHSWMGSSGTHFARNLPVKTPKDDEVLDDPNPREVSFALMTRDSIKPAPSINLLAVAWLQFQVHDWFNHQRTPDSPFEVKIGGNDPWSREFPGDVPMNVNRTEKAILDPPTYVNKEVHWWDGSQIYGSSEDILRGLRTCSRGKLKLDQNGFLPYDEGNKVDLTGFTENWWFGLRLLHTLFTWEHNNICDMLYWTDPCRTDEEIFNKARLINTALMAKIHTIEWTPALLSHPTVILGMKADWCGLEPAQFSGIAQALDDPASIPIPQLSKIIQDFNLEAWTGKTAQQLFDILKDPKQGPRKLVRMLIEGSPKRMYKTQTDYVQGVPEYAMTEEFVSVYRMHPFMPDAVSLRHLENDDPVMCKELLDISELVGEGARNITGHGKLSMVDAFYSFGTEYPGALMLNNFPNFLSSFLPPDSQGHIDLAAVDILRDRERGVPRYCEFRRLLFGDPRPDRPDLQIKTFDDITGKDATLAEKLRKVYGKDDNGNDNVEKVDLMVGLFAEPRPPGFAFSETTFFIFALMTPFRLKSDRWFTEDYHPDKYTPEGMAWIENNSMRSVLARNFPSLRQVLRHVKNPFKPWVRTAA